MAGAGRGRISINNIIGYMCIFKQKKFVINGADKVYKRILVPFLIHVFGIAECSRILLQDINMINI